MKDRDTGADAQRLQAAAWAVITGTFGAIAGSMIARASGMPALVGGVAGVIVGVLLVLVAVPLIAERIGRGATSILAPSGATTPAVPGFSRADSLLVRGRFDEAIAELERNAQLRPDDPHACLRLARVYRDQLKDFEQARRWFIEARSRAVDPGIEQLAVRELVEVLVRRMGEPGRALPELARFAELRRGTPAGDWAAAELAELRRRTASEPRTSHDQA